MTLKPPDLQNATNFYRATKQ